MTLLAQGIMIGHVDPEAARGGPLAAVRFHIRTPFYQHDTWVVQVQLGDTVTIDLTQRTLNVNASPFVL